MKIEIENVGKFKSIVVSGKQEYNLLWEFLNGSMTNKFLIEDFLEQYESESEGFEWGGNSGEVLVSGNSATIIPTYNEELRLEVPINTFLECLKELERFLSIQ